MLPKSSRLTVRDIDSLSQGKSVFGTLFSVRYVPSKTLKFSVSVSKKVTKEAVDRNRIRRRLYSVLESVLKNNKSEGIKPVFAMIMPKKECQTIDFKVLSVEVSAVLKKAGILA